MLSCSGLTWDREEGAEMGVESGSVVLVRGGQQSREEGRRRPQA